jgi:hypothetical protein
MNTNAEHIQTQIAGLRARWNDLAAIGNHAEAVAVENEIAALERASARHAVQQQAEAVAAVRARAVDAAKAVLGQIDLHKGARAELEAVVSDIESAVQALDAAMSRLEPAWSRAVGTWPRWETFRNAQQQAAYDEALAGNRHPKFEPLRLALRLPRVIDVLATRANAGLNHILSVADARF